jgi:hypothetical protein
MSKFLGHFSAYLKDEPSQIIWEKKNVEVIVGGWLLAWVMASQAIATSAVSGSSPIPYPDFPIWGLAIGNADSTLLPPNADEQKLRQTLVNEFFRKHSEFTYFLDPAKYLPNVNSSGVSEKVPVPYITPYLEVQTIFNSNLDVKLQASPTITEMGLVGGSTTVISSGINNLGLGGGPVNQPNCGILLDYLTPEPFQIPLGRDFVIAVVLDFTH